MVNTALFGREFTLHTLYGTGYPTGHAIQFQGMRMLFGFICHTSELFEQSICFSKHIAKLDSLCYIKGLQVQEPFTTTVMMLRLVFNFDKYNIKFKK